MANEDTIKIENARIAFRNFAGKRDKYNKEGDRNFSILLDPSDAATLMQLGWNVKTLKPREGVEDSVPQPYIQVAVSYRIRPPRIVTITSRGRTPIGEDEVEVLDYADIKQADVILNPYRWTVDEESGIKAYLKTLFVILNEDELELKYSQIEDAPISKYQMDDDNPPF